MNWMLTQFLWKLKKQIRLKQKSPKKLEKLLDVLSAVLNVTQYVCLIKRITQNIKQNIINYQVLRDLDLLQTLLNSV